MREQGGGVIVNIIGPLGPHQGPLAHSAYSATNYGLIGLTQGFFVAGADYVVASLWPVPDRGTAFLMEELYRGLLLHDLSPSAALRRAQQSAAAERRWADPFYWAGFILQRGR